MKEIKKEHSSKLLIINVLHEDGTLCEETLKTRRTIIFLKNLSMSLSKNEEEVEELLKRTYTHNNNNDCLESGAFMKYSAEMKSRGHGKDKTLYCKRNRGRCLRLCDKRSSLVIF